MLNSDTSKNEMAFLDYFRSALEAKVAESICRQFLRMKSIEEALPHYHRHDLRIDFHWEPYKSPSSIKPQPHFSVHVNLWNRKVADCPFNPSDFIEYFLTSFSVSTEWTPEQASLGEVIFNKNLINFCTFAEE
jgi:hypothetical protein